MQRSNQANSNSRTTGNQPSSRLPQRQQYQYQSIDDTDKKVYRLKEQPKNNQGGKRKNKNKNYQPKNPPNNNQLSKNNQGSQKKPDDKAEYVERKRPKYVEKSQTNTEIQSSQIDQSVRGTQDFDEYPGDNSSEGSNHNSVNKYPINPNQDIIEQKFHDLFLPFEDEMFYERKLRRIPVVKQYGQQNERLIKRCLKRYLSNENIRKIQQIYLLVDQAYPHIQLQYSTQGGKQKNISILTLFKSIDTEPFQKQLKKFIRELFYSNYTEIDPQQLNIYYDAIQSKVKELKLHCDFYKRKDKNVKNILACYCSYEDQFNLLGIDHFWNEIRLNGIFLELNKGRFDGAYKVYHKMKMNYLREEKERDKEENNMLVGNEEMSSDEEDIIIHRPNMDQIHTKLTNLFQDSLNTFDQDMKKMQEQQEELRANPDNDSQQKLQKVMEQISELHTALTDYKERRRTLQAQFKKLDRNNERVLYIYKELKMLRNQLSSKLPIISRKKQLFKQLDKHNLIVLEGETGSGKSTQLPQILCEYYKIYNNTKSSKCILLTQPRKIATRTLAERIAVEMEEQVHGFVDYVSSTGKKPQKGSKIILMLDRLLLDELEKDPLLSKYHCLVIDEAHERTLSIDILIGLIKTLLTKRNDFKVIITSATLDAVLFERYFQIKTFKVSGRMFPVDIIYKPLKEERLVDKVKKVLNEEVLKAENRDKYRGHVLVFCTNVEEINVLCNEYHNRPGVKALPLHGKLTTEEQKLIFEPEERMTKLIFSTRIAETAVTIDKVKVVIDPGEDRQTVYDQKKKITAFQLKPISKSAAKQRAGRAGRTASGFCFRLYSKQFQHKNMTDNKNPQIMTVPLDTLVLRLKQLKISDIINFPYLESPNQQALKQSQDRMQIIGCLDDFSDITEIGLLLVKIPIEPFMSRALAEGIIIDTNNPRRKILPQLLKTLVMIVNGQSIFYSKYGDQLQRQELQKLKFYQFADKEGDFFSLLKVYQAFQQQCKNRRHHTWCRDKFLNKKTLFQASELYKQVKQIIDNVKLDMQKCRAFESQVMQKQRLLKNNRELILSCILPSFCQQLCLYSGNSKIGYTSIKRQVPLQIYGSSFLSLQGINPKWIISFDVFKTSNMFCRLAQSIKFDLLKISVPPRLLKRYKIEECQNSNPFYQCISQNLPTVLFDQLKKKYSSNCNRQFDFLQQSTLLFYFDLNKVELYVNKNKIDQTKKKFKQKLKLMSQQIQSQYSKYTHHYLGSVTAIMSSGCQTKLLNFKNYLYAAKIYNLAFEIQYMIQVLYRQNVVKTEVNGRGLIVYFENQIHRKSFKQWLDGFKSQYFKQFSKTEIRLEKGFQQRRDKIATVKIRLRFFIGQPRTKSNLLLMGYNKEEGELAQQFMKTYDSQERCVINGTRVGKGKDRPAITVFLAGHPSVMDEVDFQNYINEIMTRHNVYGWISPPIIKGFRQIDTNLATKTDGQWIEQIKKMIQDVDEQDIRLKGYGPKDSPYYTQINAYISMYDTVAAEQFKRKYNGKRNVLGNQKTHISITYSQTMVKLSPYIFEIFQKKFRIQKGLMQAQFVNLKIDERRFNTKRGQTFVVIQSFSNRRQDLMKPARVIKQIFKAEQIPLDSLQIKIMNKRIGQEGRRSLYLSDRIFHELRFEFSYCVEFQMLRKFTYVKIYSCQNNFQQIQKRLKEKIKEFEKMMIAVFYRGRNIHSVIKILEERKAKKQIEYNVVFSSKLVQLIGGLEILAQVENQIMKLSEQSKGDCSICSSIMLSPFCLFNCKHTYCRFCLISSIRTQTDDLSKYPLKCPEYQSCQTLLNINDLKSLFSQQQFDKMCDRGVQKQIDDKTYHGCATNDCQMIFQVSESKKHKSYTCDLCTMSYCFMCKDIKHDGISCAQNKQMKNPDYADKMLQKIGVKKCGRCQTPIYKDGGCLHVHCSKCNAHICWKCERIFATSEQCYDHLAKNCGGIFDPNDVEVMRMPPRNQRMGR